MTKTKIVTFGILFILLRTPHDIKADTHVLSYLNTTVDPCEDFYEYACGNFANVHPVPNNALTVDHFTLLEEELTVLLNATLSVDERSEDPEALKKAKSAYKACINVDFLDAERDPEMDIVEAEHGFPLVQPDELYTSMEFGWYHIGEMVSKYGIPMIFDVRAYQHPKDASKNIIFILQDRLANPSMIRPHKEMTYDDVIQKGFLELAEKPTLLQSGSELAPFDIFLRTMAFKIGRNEPHQLPPEDVVANIEDMVNFWRSVYRGGILPENETVPEITSEASDGYTVTLREVNEWIQNQFGSSIRIDWVEYMQRVFKNSGVEITGDTEMLLQQGLNNLIYGMLNLVKQTPGHVVKNFVMMRIFLYMAMDSDHESRNALQEYFTKINYNVLPRWQYCTRKLIDSDGPTGLSFAVAYEYQLRHYNVNSFSTVTQMLLDLQKSFSEIISESPWMDDETKTIALQKLEKMVTIMGFPDFITYKDKLNHFYENLRICKFDNYGNSQRLRAFKQAYQMSQLGKRNRAFWDKSPFETNAYYNRPNNRIILPLAMLHPEFFSGENRIIDYSRIGSIIGHEITHGFDTQGRKYDQDGSMNDWGSTSSFVNYTNCFVDQYNKYYIPAIDAYVNGTITLNENLADNGGTKESYRAMKKLTSAGKLINEDYSGYTDDQLFFLGFGTMWCSNPTQKYLQEMQSDAHAASKWRVNGVVSNMKEFSEAFNCPSGSKMNPVEKCKLW